VSVQVSSLSECNNTLKYIMARWVVLLVRANLSTGHGNLSLLSFLVGLIIKLNCPLVRNKHLSILIKVILVKVNLFNLGRIKSSEIIFLRQANFMTCNSSNRLKPREARRLSAVCLLAEKSRSQGTEEAWQGRTSRAMRARVG
jgi:hypothetical protein